MTSAPEGPYRDLGSGFARLTGVEGARRGPSRISHVEDALLELLRNARDADAKNVFVASSLSRRRFRTLTVIDDGGGIPGPYADLVFEPGVTTRHLDPVRENAAGHAGAPHGAGLALYHLREAAAEARVVSASSPTAIRATFDTRKIPERALQSSVRPSKSNLRATLLAFARNAHPNTFYGSPATILATLFEHHIIQNDGSGGVLEWARGLGLDLSHRTVQRVLGGGVRPVEAVSGGEGVRSSPGDSSRGAGSSGSGGGPVLPLGADERAGIAAILSRAARAAYLEVEDLNVEARPGEVYLKARVYEPEEEYE